MRFLIACLTLLAAACASADEEPAEPRSGAETGGMCGGIAGIPCSDGGDYCAYERGACLNTADAAGVCRKRPEACTMEYNPVCGCDGKTYGNACSAAGQGVSIAHAGECKEDQ